MDMTYDQIHLALKQGVEKVNELILENDELKQCNLKFRKRIRQLEDQIRPPVKAPKIGNMVRVKALT